MRAGGGKSKGGAFERLVCKKLSLWLSDGKNESLLWRSAMSGGRATVAHSKNKLDDQVGDISAVTEEGYQFTKLFCVECKSYNNIRLESLLTRKASNPSVLLFWNEIDRLSQQVEKLAMLIFKQNKGEIYVLTKLHNLKTLWPGAFRSTLSPVVEIDDYLALVRLDDFTQTFRWSARPLVTIPAIH